MAFLKGLLVTMLCADVGVILALAMHASVVGAVGLGLLFGAIGYLVYDWEKVSAAAPLAWHRVKRIASKPVTFPWSRFKNAWWGFWAGVALASTIGVGLTIMVLLTLVTEGQKLLDGWQGRVFICYSGLMIMAGLAVSPLAFISEDTSEQLAWIAKWLNVFSVMYLVIVGICRASYWLMWTGLPLAVQFLWELTCEIYADIRLVIALSVFAGVLTGWRHQNLFDGVAFAAVLFTVQYLCIHLPVRNSARNRS